MNDSKTKIENIVRDFYILYNPEEEMYKIWRMLIKPGSFLKKLFKNLKSRENHIISYVMI